MENNLVVQSNDLVTSAYSMSLKEKVIILACMSQIDSRPDAPVITEQSRFTVTVKQMTELFYSESNEKNAYRDLANACVRLKRREVSIKLDDNKELLTDFVSGVLFDPDNCEVTLTFAEDILPHLTELKSSFTKYKLVEIAELTSLHSIRLYELIICWIGRRSYSQTMDLEDFRSQVGVGGSYKKFSQLRESVIEKAIAEINEKTSYRVSVDYRKVGKSYVGLTLSFYKKESLHLTDSSGKLSQDKIRAVVRTPQFVADYNDHRLLSVEARDSNEAFWAKSEYLLAESPEEFTKRPFDDYFKKAK